MARIRITGLVRLMNQVRQQLAAGIPPAQHAEFRSMVSGTLTHIEQICHKHRLTPAQLPVPSYRAYCFLKEIDLKHLPVGAQADQPLRPARIANLTRACDDLNQQMFLFLQEGNLDAEKLTVKHVLVKALHDQVGKQIRRVEKVCQAQGSTPAALPEPSRRAYQWLCFLNDAGELVTHLQTLDMALRLAHQPSLVKRAPAARRGLPVVISMYNLAALYRVRLFKDHTRLVFHEGFSSAPPEILEALITSAISGKTSPRLALLREYAAGEDFNEISLSMALANGQADVIPLGQHYDLAEVFERVNARYFGGKMTRPRLVWSRVLTQRKFGHYQPNSDTIMLSLTLDDADVPEYVLDFVMYHELLHKKLGMHPRNGRHYAHTPEFRREERRFARYQDAQDSLNRLARGK